MFEERVHDLDKPKMMDEIVDNGLMEPDSPRGLLHREAAGDPGNAVSLDNTFVSPPDPFDADFIEYHWPERSRQTSAAITLPGLHCKLATLGNVSGLKQALHGSRDLLASVRGLWAAMQKGNGLLDAEILEGMSRSFKLMIQQQEKKTGQQVPEPATQGVELNPRLRIEQSLKQIDRSLAPLRNLDFHISEGEGPGEMILQYDTENMITITAPAHSNGVIMIFSKMDSTYAFPGKGTNWGERLVGPNLAFGDRPWFAKVAIPAGQIIDENGLPFASFPTNIAQLGVAGNTVQVHQYTVTIPGNGELKLPVQLNGCYGKARIIFLPDDTQCRPVDETFLVQGQYEENYREQEILRHHKVEAARNLVAANITLAEQLFSSMAAAIATLPELGPVLNTAMRTLHLFIGHTKQSILETLKSRNGAQQKINFRIAGEYPRSGLVGLPQDNYSPH